MAAVGSRSSEMQCDFLPFGVGVRQNDTEEDPLVKSGRHRRREGQSNGWSRRRQCYVSAPPLTNRMEQGTEAENEEEMEELHPKCSPRAT